MSSAEYRQNAQTCTTLAAQVTDAQVRSSMLSMAAAWTRLALMADKNQTLDLVYETPDPPSQTQPMQQQQQKKTEAE